MLYSHHPPALQTLYAEIERFALSQQEVFVGSPGSLTKRANDSGFEFYSRQYYDADGRKREEYIAGPVGSGNAEATVSALSQRIQATREWTRSIRLLGREGYNLASAKTFATTASLHNHGVFRAGGWLVGTHAYGVLLNRLGIRAAYYFTEDVDIARKERLALGAIPEGGFLEMLNGSGLTFLGVPRLDHHALSTSFKLKGVSSFHVDLLVPSRDNTFPVVPVPELKAHATGIPHLAYLLGEEQWGAMLSREGFAAVRVPLPERFAVHKLIVAQSRTGREAKSEKDMSQAAVLLAFLGDRHPGAIEDARQAVPKSAAKHLARATQAIEPILAKAHPRAWEELSGG